VQKTRKLE